MDEELNYYVLFRGDFPWPDDEYFAASDELAEFLEQGLQERGLVIEKIDRSELGHYFTLKVGDVSINLLVSADILIDETGQFSLMPFENTTFWGRPVSPSHEDYRDLLTAINEVLQESERVSDIRWFPSFETSEYLNLMPPSEGPIREPTFEDNLPTVIKWDIFLTRITRPSVAIPLFLLIALGFMIVSVIEPKLQPMLIAIGVTLFLSMIFLIPLVMCICLRSLIKRQQSEQDSTESS